MVKKPTYEELDCIGISFLNTCRGGIYGARYYGFDKSNPYLPAIARLRRTQARRAGMSAPKVRYVQQRVKDLEKELVKSKQAKEELQKSQENARDLLNAFPDWAVLAKLYSFDISPQVGSCAKW